MKQKFLIDYHNQPIILSLRKNQHFRIRSTSKQHFISTLSNSKHKSIPQHSQESTHYQNHIKLKNSNKQLRKIIIKSTHHRQKSLNFDKPELINNQNQSQSQDTQLNKLQYECIRTEQTHLNHKKWIDINIIDTSQDIKILDRINTIFDPYKLMKQNNSKVKLTKKSQDSKKNQIRSISNKKSKLTDKINTLVFHMNSNSDHKQFKLHKNKFQVQGYSRNQSVKKIQHDCSIRSNKKVQIQNNLLQSQAIINLQNNDLQISKQLVNHNKKNNQTNRKNQTKKLKEKCYNNKKEMQQYWAEVNQSLILAAQEEYVSKDLRELVFDNI